MARKRLFILICTTILIITPMLGSAVKKSRNFGLGRNLHIVCLGDSITCGWRLPAPKEMSFPAHLRLLSDLRWKIDNAGVPGATALKNGDIPIWTTPVFSSVMASKPDIVVLMLGTNDTKDRNWRFREQFGADYQDLVTQLKKLPSSPEVILCSIPPVVKVAPYGITNARTTELSLEVEKIARATNTRYVDVTSVLGQNSDLFLDGLHPNEIGDAIIATTLMEFITRL